MIETCKCGGLYATEQFEMFAGTPCKCPAPTPCAPAAGKGCAPLTGSAPWEAVERRELWGYLSETGELLPSTIRQRAGDCDPALAKTDQKYRSDPSKATLVRVLVEWKAQNGRADLPLT